MPIHFNSNVSTGFSCNSPAPPGAGSDVAALQTRAERDAAYNEKLLRALEGVPPEQRTARFVCVMSLADPDGSLVAEARGREVGRASGPTALVVGSEADGPSEPVRAAADELVGLRMAAPVESLNVAVTAGVLLYRLTDP